MKVLKFVFLFVFTSSYITLAQNIERKFVSAEINASGDLSVIVSDGIYTVTPFNSKITQTTFVPSGQKFIEDSHAVILNPINSKPQFAETKSTILFKTSGIEVNIQKSPFQISYIYKGKEIISEKLGYSKIENGESIQFNLTNDEILYGGGARALDMNRRGNRLELYNKAHYGYETHSELMNYTMPLVLSSKIYAVHFDNAPIGFLDLDSKNDSTLTYETISGRKTYQVIVGNSWLDLIDNYTDLTGKQPLPPRWALGNFSSRFGYHSEMETRETVNKFEEENIPLDAVIIDIYWFGKEIQGTMGNLEFHKDSFPTPIKMIKDFQEKGVNTVLVTEPFILSTSNRWDEAVENDVLAKDSVGNPYQYDFYFGNTGLIDIYKPEAKLWFWNIYENLANMGIKGVWGDLGEPEVHPENLIHATGSANEKHNIYGHDWARLVSEGYKEHFPNERPFILMRAGYSGSQRFGLIPWSGDVNRTWGGLQSQPKIALQMGMQGLGYMHSDLGGFAGSNLDDELYNRWLQYGVFQPIYRPHAQEEVPPEPVFREDNTKALAKKSIEIRYSLLPYNYTLAYENSQTGAPLMRPLFFEEPDNIKLQKQVTSYLWGNDFLITPILESSVIEKEIYFPKNSNWFDFYTDKKVEGGKTETVKVNESSIPTYVRAGAFIPLAKPMQSTQFYNANSFDLHYYHDVTITNSHRELFNDDGTTSNSQKKEAYEIISFNSEFDKKNLNFNFTVFSGANFDSENKDISFTIHTIQKEPKRIKVNGKKIKFTWVQKNQTVILPINLKDNLEIRIKL